MRAIIGRFTVLLCLAVLVANVVAASALADIGGCPKGLSQLDCAAIFGNWPNWIPDDGTACSSSTTTDTIPGGDNKQKAFNYFVSKGLSDIQAAAIVGNLIVESSVSTSADQSNGPGLGIAQWGNPGRWNTLEDFATQQGRDKFDLGLQLDFMWHELQEQPYSTALDNTKKQTSIEDATAYFMGTAEAGLHPGNVVDSVAQSYIDKDGRFVGYENPGTPHLDLRIQAAQITLNSFGGGSSGGVSGSDASCGSSGSVDCSGSSAATDASSGALSQVRQQVVCLAQAELALWTSGQMKVGYRSSSADSFAKYSQNNDELWCADFASWIYNQAGYPIGTSPNWRVASVDGIHTIGDQDQKFHYHAAGNYTPKPGDLVLHQTRAQSHVNIVISVNANANSMVIIGGDQPPTTSAGYPDGSVVSKYSLASFSGTDNITGYVSPD
jgi:hypothetical protein